MSEDKPLTVWGTYNPKRTDDLKDEAKQYIGKRLLWRYMWEIEDGEYAGQYAMMPDYIAHKDMQMGWSPECDVDLGFESMTKFGKTSIHASGQMMCKVCGKELHGLGTDEFRMEFYTDANKTAEYTCNGCVLNGSDLRIKKEWTKFTVNFDVGYEKED